MPGFRTAGGERTADAEGAGGRREGPWGPGRLADRHLRATHEQLCDALGACQDLDPVYRRLLKMALEDLQLIEKQISELDQEIANLLARTRTRSNGWRRCPGWESIRRSRLLPKWAPWQRPFLPREPVLMGRRVPRRGRERGCEPQSPVPRAIAMRRLLNQAANAAVKYKGSIFESFIAAMCPPGHKQTIGVIAHRLCRLIWKILHQGVRYEERGPDVRKKSQRCRAPE